MFGRESHLPTAFQRQPFIRDIRKRNEEIGRPDPVHAYLTEFLLKPGLDEGKFDSTASLKSSDRRFRVLANQASGFQTLNSHGLLYLGVALRLSGAADEWFSTCILPAWISNNQSTSRSGHFKIENPLKGSAFSVLLRIVAIRKPMARTASYFLKALHVLFLITSRPSAIGSFSRKEYTNIQPVLKTTLSSFELTGPCRIADVYNEWNHALRLTRDTGPDEVESFTFYSGQSRIRRPTKTLNMENLGKVSTDMAILPSGFFEEEGDDVVVSSISARGDVRDRFVSPLGTNIPAQPHSLTTSSSEFRRADLAGYKIPAVQLCVIHDSPREDVGKYPPSRRDTSARQYVELAVMGSPSSKWWKLEPKLELRYLMIFTTASSVVVKNTQSYYGATASGKDLL
ncbi:hypothetical protein F5146DRAFT_1156288 [Armillaria mellea]|nr:hypothetical protein F5146DRAFT_1156288 [Armillaria mellea]